MPGMPTSERAYHRARRRAEGLLRLFGNDVRDARLTAGLSQMVVARRLAWSNAKVSRIEAGSARGVALLDAVVLADTVGLDLSIKTYPGRRPTRDAPQARRLQALLAHVGRPIQYRVEALLPARNGTYEQRAWDALLTDPTGETGL